MDLANKSNTKESFLDIQLTSLEITFVLDIKAFDSFFSSFRFARFFDHELAYQGSRYSVWGPITICFIILFFNS